MVFGIGNVMITILLITFGILGVIYGNHGKKVRGIVCVGYFFIVLAIIEIIASIVTA